MREDPRYPWDVHSDQPHVLRDRSFKRGLYLRGAWGSIKTVLSALVLPFLLPRWVATPRTMCNATGTDIGLCVNPVSPQPDTCAVPDAELLSMVAELGIDSLLIRLPLSDIDNLERYAQFAACFNGRKLVFNVLQDRRHIENNALLERSLRNIFKHLGSLSKHFVIGNAVNRRKWAFVSLDEYFDFFNVAQTLRDSEFPDLQLAGGTIIDFELPNFARALWHRRAITYDATAALLYVDRRGAPENRQFGCDLLAKLRWFHVLVTSSKKSGGKLWVTEVNWPLRGTEPWAPATGDCMVDEDQQASFLARYYLLVLASGKVEKCFWHQLLAPGYGLVDNRGDTLRKRKAYYAFKTLCKLFDGGTIEAFIERRDGTCQLDAKGPQGAVRALWIKPTRENSENGASLKDASLNDDDSHQHLMARGEFEYKLDHCGSHCEKLSGPTVTLGDEVVYLLKTPIESGNE